MSIINVSHVEITTFILVGIPGLEYAHLWISIPIPICSMYLIALLGNCTILFVIKTEPSLHEPMYYFLSMLSLSDIGLSFSSLPTRLRIFLFKASEISANACFAQQFFIHGFTALESSVLLIMSSDYFLAIHNPLRYSSILTTLRVAQIGIVCFFKSFLLVLPFPSTLRMLTYCKKCQLSHSYCLPEDVMKLACSDNQIDVIYGFFGALCIMVDFMLTAMSRILILKMVLGTESRKEQLKALDYFCFTYLRSDHLLSAHHQPCHISSFCPPCLSPLQCFYGKCSLTCASTDESHHILCENQAD